MYTVLCLLSPFISSTRKRGRRKESAQPIYYDVQYSIVITNALLISYEVAYVAT